LRAKRKSFLLGMMTRMPVAGVVWQYLHYLIGLQRLGYDVYYVEAHAIMPTGFMQSRDRRSFDQGGGVYRFSLPARRHGGQSGASTRRTKNRRDVSACPKLS
jgi:hypothetical protein